MEPDKHQLLLERANESLFAAKRDNALFHAENDPRSLAAVWSSFLENYVKTFKFLREATNFMQHKGWSAAIKSEQRSDAQLSYLLHARNANGHGLSFIATPHHNFVALGNFVALEEGGSVSFEDCSYDEITLFGKISRPLNGYFTVVDGKPVGNLPSGIPVTAIPKHLELHKVVDRGVPYSVPNQTVPRERQAVQLLDYATAWLEKKADEARTLIS